MSRFSSTATTAAILVVAAAGFSGCASSSGAGQLSATQKYTSTVPVSSVIVNDKVGAVSVSSGSGREVTVTATIRYDTSRPSITHTISGRALTLGYSACMRCSVAFTVTVPRTASVAIHEQTGDVTVTSLAGDVSVGDAIGRVTMTGLTGDVSVKDDKGDVRGTGLSAARASLYGGIGSIDVAFTAAPRQLSAVSGTGDVSLRVPAGTHYQVSASSKIGSVSVSVSKSTTATHVITAASTIGDVSVRNG